MYKDYAQFIIHESYQYELLLLEKQYLNFYKKNMPSGAIVKKFCLLFNDIQKFHTYTITPYPFD